MLGQEAVYLSEQKTYPKRALFYLLVLYWFYMDMKRMLFSYWFEPGDERSRVFGLLLTMAFLVLAGQVFARIYEGRTFRQWRSVMKKSICSMILLLLCTVAFVVLMVEAYTYMQNPRDAILLIVASTAIFLPNVWALTDYVACKMKKKPEPGSEEKTEDGSEN